MDSKLGFATWSLNFISQFYLLVISSYFTGLVQFSLVTQSCLTFCNPMDCSIPGFPVHHQLLELTQTHVYWVSDAIKPSHPLSSPSPPAFNLSQGLFKWVSSSHQVAKVLEFQLQHQSFLLMALEATKYPTGSEKWAVKIRLWWDSNPQPLNSHTQAG